MSERFFLGILLACFVSLGVYRAMLEVVRFFLIKCKALKELVFGNMYLEGTWVGCCLGDDGNPLYYIESFEQDFDGLVVRGRSYDADKSYKGSWVSDTVMIDTSKGKITYTYVTDMISNTHNNQGLAEFSFVRENKLNPPQRMIGFSSDIFNPKKLLSVEERIQKGESTDEISLLRRAESVFENNKGFFVGVDAKEEKKTSGGNRRGRKKKDIQDD